MRFNADHTRATSGEGLFGFACYARTGEDGDGGILFTHRGVVETEADAARWLAGETPKSLIQIFNTRPRAPRRRRR